MKYLVTGGAGFIGSNLTDKLLHENHSVVIIDNFDPFYAPSIKRANISHALQNPQCVLEEGDIRDRSFMRSVFARHSIDTVVHLAAKAGVRPSLADPLSYSDVNVNGTIVLLECMRESRLRKCIFASSSSVYGDSENVPFRETDNVDFPISPYAATKKAGELICHTYCSAYGFDIFSMRFFTVYGPRQRPEMAIHKFASLIMAEKPITVYGDGSSLRDYTYIDDIVQGIVNAAQRVKGYEILNLGESQTTSLMELISYLEKSLNKKAIIEFLPHQMGDVKKTFADIRKAQDLIGYQPSTPVSSGIAKFSEWFLQNK